MAHLGDEVIEQDGANVGLAVAVGVTQQRDLVGSRNLAVAEPLDDIDDDALGARDRLARALGLDGQDVAIG